MIPFAVAFKSLTGRGAISGIAYGTIAFIEILVFLATLVVGYIYVWKKGTFRLGTAGPCRGSGRGKANGKEASRTDAAGKDSCLRLRKWVFRAIRPNSRIRNQNMGLENTLFESLPDVVTVKLDAVVNWARKIEPLAGDIRPRVLCDRDDEYRLCSQ